MWTTSQISNPAFDYRHQGFSVKILELERDAHPPPARTLDVAADLKSLPQTFYITEATVKVEKS